jgi:hypothetical protein
MYKCADDVKLELKEFYIGIEYILLKDSLGQIYWKKNKLKPSKLFDRSYRQQE